MKCTKGKRGEKKSNKINNGSDGKIWGLIKFSNTPFDQTYAWRGEEKGN
jgi:hypothetical protein